MHFSSPIMLWLLIAVPLLVAFYVVLLRRRKPAAIRIASVEVIREADLDLNSATLHKAPGGGN